MKFRQDKINILQTHCTETKFDKKMMQRSFKQSQAVMHLSVWVFSKPAQSPNGANCCYKMHVFQNFPGPRTPLGRLTAPPRLPAGFDLGWPTLFYRVAGLQWQALATHRREEKHPSKISKLISLRPGVYHKYNKSLALAFISWKKPRHKTLTCGSGFILPQLFLSR